MKNTCKFIHTNVIIFSFFFNLLKMSVSGLIYYLQDLWREYCLTNTIFLLFIFFLTTSLKCTLVTLLGFTILLTTGRNLFAT